MNPQVKNLIKVVLLTLVNIPLLLQLASMIHDQISPSFPGVQIRDFTCSYNGGFTTGNPCDFYNRNFLILFFLSFLFLFATYILALNDKKWALGANIGFVILSLLLTF